MPHDGAERLGPPDRPSHHRRDVESARVVSRSRNPLAAAASNTRGTRRNIRVPYSDGLWEVRFDGATRGSEISWGEWAEGPRGSGGSVLGFTEGSRKRSRSRPERGCVKMTRQAGPSAGRSHRKRHSRPLRLSDLRGCASPPHDVVCALCPRDAPWDEGRRPRLLR